MLVIKKILMPRLNNLSFIQVSVDALEKPFERAVKESLFSLPEEEKKECYYTLSVNRGESPLDQDFFVTVDIDLAPLEGELFVAVAGGAPQIKKCARAGSAGGKILGTVCKVSRETPEEFEACDVPNKVKNKSIWETIQSF